MDTLWRKLRGPFYCLDCVHDDEHEWEQFDCNKAGCLQCGKVHVCCDNVNYNKSCRLELQDDGAHTCTITGLSVASNRVAAREYIDHCSFERKQGAETKCNWDTVHDEVNFILSNFIKHSNMRPTKQREQKKMLQRIQNSLSQYLKSFKLKYGQKRVVFHDMLAFAIHTTNPIFSTQASPALINKCVTEITRCIIDLNVVKSSLEKQSLVIGLLYLMKSGLEYQNELWLPKINALNFCLPHENSLEKYFGISVKIICDTENTVKMLLRTRKNML